MFPSESPRADAKVEWWFVQGFYHTASGPRQYFMTTFFRLQPEPGSAEAGHALITTVVSPDQGAHQVTTRIDQGTQDIFLASKDVSNSNLDPHMVAAYRKEISRYGPPDSTLLEATRPEVAQQELAISWNTIQLNQTNDCLLLQCLLPNGDHGDFTLTPASNRCQYGDLQSGGSMTCNTYPRMQLQGKAGEEEVSGRAWFDHQWGNYGYFFSNSTQEGVLGWDWLGINLDCGVDIILLIRRAMKDQSIVYQIVQILQPDGSFIPEHNFTLTPLRLWESPHTHIKYPVEMRLEIPAHDLSLTIQAFADDQEIPFFGIIRSIWEGAGRVSGSYQGEEVTGVARIEFHGYGYIFDTRQYMDTFVSRIDDHIADFFPATLSGDWLRKTIGPEHWRHDPASCTAALAEPVWDLISRKGKHWRPICAMLLLESTGVSSAPYEQLIAAVTELNHSGSLIIDDIEDDSTIRRGDDCIHLRYGIDTAINAGNTLYFLPYLLLKDHPGFTDRQRLQSYELMVQMLTRVHCGQGLDISWSKQLSPARLERWLQEDFDQQIIQMYSYKTGAQLEGVAEMACVIADSDQETRKHYAALGRMFGVAYQIIDDIHNFNQSPGWTKVCGEDIAAGKPTYVIIQALRRMKTAQRLRFMEIFCSKSRRQSPDLREAVALIRQSGALEFCRREAETMIDREWQNFSAVAQHNDAKIMLRMFIAALLNYSYDY